MLVADYEFGDGFLTALSVFFFVIWIWVLIVIIGDVFRDHELSGGAKAAWVFFLIFVPVVTVLVYLVTRGAGMRERAVKEQAEVQDQMAAYIRQTAGTSPVDELAKLTELHEKGALSTAEFEQAKAKLLK